MHCSTWLHPAVDLNTLAKGIMNHLNAHAIIQLRASAWKVHLVLRLQHWTVRTCRTFAAGCCPPGTLCMTAAWASAAESASGDVAPGRSRPLSSASGLACFARRGTTLARVCASVASLLRKLWKPCRLSIALCFLCSVSLGEACTQDLFSLLPRPHTVLAVVGGVYACRDNSCQVPSRLQGGAVLVSSL